jgi:uncharacterized protein (DUF1800 family)
LRNIHISVLVFRQCFTLLFVLLAGLSNTWAESDPPGTPGLRDDIRQLAKMRSGLREAQPGEGPVLQKALQGWMNEKERDAIEASLRFHLLTQNSGYSDWVWFWGNHFSVFSKKSAVKILLADYEATGIRAHLEGGFSELLRNAVLHPAMLVYLDNTQNRKGKHNENLAREILELHTLGINGGYTQADIQALASALSGITVWNPDNRIMQNCRAPACQVLHPAGTLLVAAQHASGPKTFMGKRYADDDGLAIVAMLEDLSRNQKTQERLSRKILEYWVQDEPLQEHIRAMVSVWQSSAGLLSALRQQVETIAHQHPAEPRIKDPFRHIRDAMRTLSSRCQAEINNPPRLMRTLLERLGMGHYQRISPDGHPLSADYWNSGDTLLQRLDAAQTLVNRITDDRRRTEPLGQCATRLQTEATAATRQALQDLQGNPKQWLTLYLISPDLMFH